jgi:two-component system, response regulator
MTEERWTGVDILMVEDNPDDSDLALETLREHRIANRIDVVRDGEEALRYLFGGDGVHPKASAELPRVILLDLKLPKVSGIEVLRAIRTHERTKHLPVVVLTSSLEDRDVVDAYELGVNSYIQKPVNFSEFAETVARLGFYWMLLNKRPA